MRVAVFSTKPYDERFLTAANEVRYKRTFFEVRLTETTAPLVAEHEVVCAFVNDDLSRTVLEIRRGNGTRLIALRSAGFNHVAITAAEDLGLGVARVPASPPFAIAEHALALILSLNCKTHRAYRRAAGRSNSSRNYRGHWCRGTNGRWTSSYLRRASPRSAETVRGTCKRLVYSGVSRLASAFFRQALSGFDRLNE